MDWVANVLQTTFAGIDNLRLSPVNRQAHHGYAIGGIVEQNIRTYRWRTNIHPGDHTYGIYCFIFSRLVLPANDCMIKYSPQLPNDDSGADAPDIVTLVFVPPRWITRNRMDALLAIMGEIQMQVVFDEEVGRLSVALGIRDEIFEHVSDAVLREVVDLFRGMRDDAYHPRLLAILKRSVN